MINKVIIFVSIIKLINAENDGTITIDTNSGTISGRTTIVEEKQLNLFLGIPYAQPPINELRFKKPIPVERWDYNLLAFQWPNTCFQIPSDHILRGLINKNMSEDCLYLNIFAPKSNILLPVIIYFHGGSYKSGSPSMSYTIPTVLSSRGNIIVVLVNYRLNTLGFLYSGNDEAPGNVGLYDQVMAMQWIKDNIVRFGGDSNRITLIGHSAGSMSVGIHLLSPLSKHLFNNAIMMSGAPLSHIWVEDKEIMYKVWAKASQTVGCGNGLNITSNDMKCLRNLNLTETTKMSFNAELPEHEKYYNHIPYVIFGDDLLPESPLIMLNEHNYKNTALLVGYTDDEGSYQLTGNLNIANESNVTYREANDAIRSMSMNIKSRIKINENISDIYFMGIQKNDSNGLLRAIGVAYGDSNILCPTIKFSKLFVNNGNRVYHYYLTSKVNKFGMIDRECPDWGGTCHGTNLYYFFGDPFIYPENYTDDERKVSEISMNVLSHFAYYGCPPPQNGIKWSYSYTINGEVIAPYYEFPSEQKPDGYFGMNIKHVECDILWEPYIYY